MRGDRQRARLLQVESEKTEAENDEVIVISNFRTKKIPSLVRCECIKRVWEMDPLLCIHCGSLMKIVSFFYEHWVIKKILAHLGLSKEAKSKRERAPPFPEMVETIIEPYDDGWPEYEGPFIKLQTL